MFVHNAPFKMRLEASEGRSWINFIWWDADRWEKVVLKR